MATNTTAGTPVPTLGDVPNVPADMLKLATYLDPVTIPRFASTVAANAAFPSPNTGQQVTINGVNKRWNGSGWEDMQTPLMGLTSGYGPLAGSMPANTQLKILGGMTVGTPNAAGHLSIATTYSTVLLTAIAMNTEPGIQITPDTDITYTSVSSWAIKFTNRFSGTAYTSPVRFHWITVGI